jgi:hypothetical protein
MGRGVNRRPESRVSDSIQTGICFDTRTPTISLGRTKSVNDCRIVTIHKRGADLRRRQSILPSELLPVHLANAGGATLASRLAITLSNGRHTMKVLCAWCVRDGRSAFLREKWPLTDLSETHGLCGDHFTTLLARAGKVANSRSGLLAPVNDLCWNLTRRGQRLVNRLLFSLC